MQDLYISVVRIIHFSITAFHLYILAEKENRNRQATEKAAKLQK